MPSSIAQTLYDLAHAEPFVPFVIHFGDGQQFEIKTPDHIGLGPVSREDVNQLKSVIVWHDAGHWRTVYLPAIIKVD